MPLLKVTELIKFYGKRQVLSGVEFELEKGQIIGLLGRNGAGKTTTFKITMGLITPKSGQVILNGENITRLPIYKRARKGLGYLPQEPSVFQKLSVEDNLLAILETLPMPGEERKKRAAQLLEEFGLSKLAPQPAYTLSGGEMRRLEISRALITAPLVMMLDEPFSGVDPIAVSDIKKIIVSLKIKKNMGVILTDHNVRETLSVTDKSYIIDEGKILAAGTPNELVNDPLVRKKYLGEDFTL
ncbi:MAG: LPS export ABC transporter ATP-binding protein [Planctomycetes bacterium]|nr:LPS export ABC transporter ATP-binding protein [Planctomycetota bacterium]